MVVPHETQMGDHRAEAVPAGKGGGVDDQTHQVAVLLDVGIDRRGQRGEVGPLES